MKRFASLCLAFMSLFLCAFYCGKDWHYGHFYVKNTTDKTFLLHVKLLNPQFKGTKTDSDYKLNPGDSVEIGTRAEPFVGHYSVGILRGFDIIMSSEDGTRLRRWVDVSSWVGADKSKYNIPTDKETALEECYVPFFKEYNIIDLCNEDEWIWIMLNDDQYITFEIRPEDLIPIPEIIAEKDNNSNLAQNE